MNNYYRGQRIRVNGKTERYKGEYGSAYATTASGKRVKKEDIKPISN